ncbi:MBL fold metallo-hydrolase [Mesorhizobium sp. RP14(2022)]|uniref:MBL fold metallo-hydrolase n=1 Tax=Mesorhizobium liriopis TaxID=2953882 RepID=A0ABT1C8E3_9HYPH|nr:MBL fold metallo-hydrolase [Mesorhizobium liriopis]MCO6051109.1 MBL fold metallo-hydrolase [Mesorhizobium liriopis]
MKNPFRSRTPKPNRYYQGPPSDHYDGSRFFNPDGTLPKPFVEIFDRKFWTERARWPKARPSPFPQAKPAKSVADLRITMVGHSSTLIQMDGVNILSDPVWSDRVSPFSFAGPARVTAPGISFEDLPPIHCVLVSHNHYDHMDMPTLKRLHAVHDPLVITPLGNDSIIHASIPKMRIAARDWDERVEVAGLSVTLTPVHHWSARWIGDRRMALWSGFMIEGHGARVFFAGDTGFDGGRPFERLTERFGPIRLALLPIGAYEPRWFMASQHEGPDEAVKAFQLCGAAYAVGIHWGMVQLTNEGVEAPRDMLFAELDGANIPRTRFRALEAGESWDIPPLEHPAEHVTSGEA